MPRTITIDNVSTVQVILSRDETGALRIHAEYHLRAGNQVVQVQFKEVTDRLSAARRGEAQTLLSNLGQDVFALEIP